MSGVPEWVRSAQLYERLEDYVADYLAALRGDEKNARSRHFAALVAGFDMRRLLSLIETVRLEEKKDKGKEEEEEKKLWWLDLNEVINDALSGFDYTLPQSSHDIKLFPTGDGIVYFVVMPDGKVRWCAPHLSHSVLANGSPVLGAGELVFRHGSLVEINNGSGHYMCHVDTLDRVRPLILAQLPSNLQPAGGEIVLRDVAHS